MKNLSGILLAAALTALQALALFTVNGVRDDIAEMRKEFRGTTTDHERRIALLEGRDERRYP